MRTEWAADLYRDMFLYEIKAAELAKEVGWHEKYLSSVLNGRRSPKDAERKLKEAMARLIERRK